MGHNRVDVGRQEKGKDNVDFEFTTGYDPPTHNRGASDGESKLLEDLGIEGRTHVGPVHVGATGEGRVPDKKVKAYPVPSVCMVVVVSERIVQILETYPMAPAE